MSRSLHTNRDFEKLEPYEGKPSRTVLRGEEGSNALDLPDRKEEELKTLKAEAERLDSRIKQTLKPIEEGMGGEDREGTAQERVPQAERRPDAPTADVPEALRRIAGASGGRIVVGSIPKYGKDVPPGKKMKR